MRAGRSRPSKIREDREMSQKDVWKDNRTSTTAGLATDEKHWLSSVVIDDNQASETASWLRLEKVEESEQ